MKWLGVTVWCLGLALSAQAPQASRRDGDPPEPETPPAQSVPDQPAAPAPETFARPPIQEIFPPAELKRLQDSADARKRDIGKVLDQMGPPRLNSQREKLSRIRSFLQLSDQAERKNDMRAADALVERAQVLVRMLQRELQSGRSGRSDWR